MEPLTDVRQISRIAYGYMASRALFTALELDLFSKLSAGSKTLEQIAGETDIAPNRMQTLLTSLVSLGLVSQDGNRYANAPASEKYLVRGAPGDYGDYVRVVNGQMMYHGMAKLTAGLRGEKAFSDKGLFAGLFYQNEVDAADFTAAQHAGSLGPAALLSKRADLAGARRLLDVGGGSGAFTIALCRHHPELEATILDFPETGETAKHYAAEAGLTSRIAHIGGDALTTDWPTGQDVVLMSYLWSPVGADDIANLARRAHGALKPGGQILVHDFMTADDHNGPQIAAWHLLFSMIDNPGAVGLTPGFVIGQLKQAGFSGANTADLLPGITSLATARKPMA